MFGHDSLPSRFYSYGGNEPVEGLATVDAQVKLAHQYRNALVDIERKRRDKVSDALLRLSPGLVQIEKQIADEEAGRELARDGIREASRTARKKVRPASFMESVKSATAALKVLYPQRKALRDAIFVSPGWKQEEEAIDAWDSSERKRLRSVCGLYWGTYLLIEQSVKRSGPPPKFHRWDGSGHLAVQLQGGLSIRKLFEGKDNRLRVEQADGARQDGGQRIKDTKVWFRVDSDDKGGPVWAVIPTVFHRPLTEDAAIKWAHLIRRRIATHYEWRVQFVLSRESGWQKPDQASNDSIGIDVGWRVLEDRSLRVAYWVDSHGQEGELSLPSGWVSEMRKTEHIRSVRDKNLNEAKAALLSWLGSGVVLPDWLKEAAKTLAQWRSQRRLSSLTIRWRSLRFPGDAVAFDALEVWRKRDKHLYEYEGNLRDQLQNRRTDIYRVFAATIRRRYKTAMIERLDLRDFHILPQAEEESPDMAVRRHTRDACLSTLIGSIMESMAETVKMPAPGTTIIHHGCGSPEYWDHKQLVHRCSKCGEEYDQDANAARNLIHGMPTSASVV